jgi:hypothetical protein
VTITFTMTAGDLVTRAMQARRCLALGRTPTAAEMAYGLERLDQMLKALAAIGSIPWAAEEAAATITANMADVTLDPVPAEVVSVGLVVSATYERPLHPWEIGQYDSLINKTQSGEPIAYIVRETDAGIGLRVWPVPTADATLNYRYVRSPEDVEQASALDLPQRYIGPMENALAGRLTVFANANPDLPALAAQSEAWLLDQARPDSYFFEPDFA